MDSVFLIGQLLKINGLDWILYLGISGQKEQNINNKHKLYTKNVLSI